LLVRKLTEQWVMVWKDEFNGVKLDPSKWAREENGYGGGNNNAEFPQTLLVDYVRVYQWVE